jgi:hypothetical protein
LADNALVARRWVVIALLLFATSARADDVMPNAVPTVMYKRWAAAVSYGVSGVQARADGADRSLLAFFEMALRFRVVTQLEVGASIGGSLGRSLGLVTIEADVRYRLAAERPWNPFLYGSGGIATWGAKDTSHLVLRGGVGLERRFRQWAFDGRVELTRVSADETAPLGRFEERNGAWAASFGVSALYYWGSGGPNLKRHGVP